MSRTLSAKGLASPPCRGFCERARPNLRKFRSRYRPDGANPRFTNEGVGTWNQRDHGAFTVFDLRSIGTGRDALRTREIVRKCGVLARLGEDLFVFLVCPPRSDPELPGNHIAGPGTPTLRKIFRRVGLLTGQHSRLRLGGEVQLDRHADPYLLGIRQVTTGQVQDRHNRLHHARIPVVVLPSRSGDPPASGDVSGVVPVPRA